MAIIALIVACFGTAAALVSLKFAARSASAAEGSAMASKRSATAVLWANASSLAPDVEVRLGEEVRERWKFIFGTTPRSPMGTLAMKAAQEETYSSPQYDNLTLALATRIHLRNFGTRAAKVQVHATSLAVESSGLRVLSANQSSAPETRRPLTENEFELLPGKKVELIVYLGQTVREWLDAKSPTEPREFTALIDIGAGPDAATLHWRLTLAEMLFSDVWGQADSVKVVPALPPKRDLVQLPRSFRDDTSVE